MHTINVAIRADRSAIWSAPEAATANRLIEILNTRTIGTQLLVRDEHGVSVMTRTVNGWDTQYQPAREVN